jgi:hypothetical protein
MAPESEREMMAMLFRKKIERSCSYCLYSTPLEMDMVLCSKKGLKCCSDNCRKFKYDPTKRVPKKEKALDFSKYDEQDFSL